jgi:hypothetical protein
MDSDDEDDEDFDSSIGRESSLVEAEPDSEPQVGPTDAELLQESISRENQLIEDKAALKAENEQLQLIIDDLARRLQNAQYTVDAHRNISNDSIIKSNRCRQDLENLSRNFQLEISKSASIQRKKTKDEEAKKYELERRRSEKCQEELRFSIIDHSMTGRTKEPASLGKLRKKLEEAEAKQDSLKALLQQFSYMEQMTEDLSNAAQQVYSSSTQSSNEKSLTKMMRIFFHHNRGTWKHAADS